MSTISIIRGDSKSLLVRVRRADGTAESLEDYSFRLTMKRRATDSMVFHEIDGRVVEGGISFNFLPSFTETLEQIPYPYDIEMYNADRTIVHTLVMGIITVTADIGGPA